MYTLAFSKEKTPLEKAQEEIKKIKDCTARQGRFKLNHVCFTSETIDGKTTEKFEILKSSGSFSPAVCILNEETKKYIKEKPISNKPMG